jgi:hypothetical protein
MDFPGFRTTHIGVMIPVFMSVNYRTAERISRDYPSWALIVWAKMLRGERPQWTFTYKAHRAGFGARSFVLLPRGVLILAITERTWRPNLWVRRSRDRFAERVSACPECLDEFIAT